MLFDRIKSAKRNLGIEEKLILRKDNELGTVDNEEVIIGQDYIDDNSDYDIERPDLGECIPRKDAESPNELDPDTDVVFDGEEIIIGMDYPEAEESDIVAEEFSNERITSKLLTPSMEAKEESMDALHSLKGKPIDDSGMTFSQVTNFLEKYAGGNDILQILRKDLMTLMSDIYWIKESKREHEQWALDFADALNELSISI